jgi:hypothetical protein
MSTRVSMCHNFAKKADYGYKSAEEVQLRYKLILNKQFELLTKVVLLSH